jgi:hypothetical protein
MERVLVILQSGSRYFNHIVDDAESTTVRGKQGFSRFNR